MHRSYQSSANRSLRGAITLLAFPLLTAPGALMNTHAAATAVFPPTRLPAAPAVGNRATAGRVAGQDTAMTPDQTFLRNRSDSHTGLGVGVHMVLHRSGTFPSKADAQNVDRRLDDELDRMRVALKSIFNDSYVPKARQIAHILTDSIATLTGATLDSTFRKFVIEYDRLEIQGIDRTLPKLTNPDVIALAKRMRASASSEMTALKAKMAILKPEPMPGG